MKEGQKRLFLFAIMVLLVLWLFVWPTKSMIEGLTSGADSCIGAAKEFENQVQKINDQNEADLEEWETKRDAYESEYNAGSKGNNLMPNMGETYSKLKNPKAAYCTGEGNYIKSFEIEDTKNYVQRIKNIKCKKGAPYGDDHIGSSRSNTFKTFSAPVGGSKQLILKQYASKGSGQPHHPIVGIKFGNTKFTVSGWRGTHERSIWRDSEGVCPPETVIKGIEGSSRWWENNATDIPAQIRIFCEPLNYTYGPVVNDKATHYQSLDDYYVKGKNGESKPIPRQNLDPGAIQCQVCEQKIKEATIGDSQNASVEQALTCIQEAALKEGESKGSGSETPGLGGANNQSQDPQNSQNSQNSQDPQDPQDPQNSQDPQDPQDSQDPQDPQDPVSEGEGLSTGAIVGIVVGVIVLLGIIGGAIFMLAR